MKGQFFGMMAVLALVFGFVGVASVRAEFCGDIPKLHREAQAGKPQAQMELSICYSHGQGVLMDAQQAEGWFRKAAEQGYAPAQFSVGSLYRHGSKEVPKDENLADQWLSKAAQGLPALAEQGDVFAQHVLGLMYMTGQGGLPRDGKLAEQWLLKAAEQGYPVAQLVLGGYYMRILKHGGLDWIRKAAAQGYVMAQRDLGMMYEEGRSVPQDIKEAKAWYRKAAKQGNVNAQQWLERLEKPCRSKCLADVNTCKAGCMGVDKADRATCNDLCAEAQRACNDSCE